MDEKEKILNYQRKRRKHKIKLGMISAVILVLSVIFILSYFTLTKNEYNQYAESAKVDYRVKLKPNDFYEEEYLEENTNPIASLIENIEASFKYSLELEKEQEYTYDYKIIAKTNVIEGKNKNSVYETTEELINKDGLEGNSKNLEITEDIKINYNDYNEKINKFINLYHLNDTTNTVQLEMEVRVINKYDGKQINKESKVVTLNIPLTTKTVDISIDGNVIENEGEILSEKSEYENIEYILWIGIALGVLGLIVFVKFVKYMLDTRSAETMYDQQLKMILFNYKNYIQKTNEEINKTEYKVIKINTFNEILGQRDTIQEQILMYTNENENRTRFTIIKDGILYEYILGAKEIRERLRAESAIRKLKKNKDKK